MKLRVLLPASLAVLLALVACSGASSTELFDQPASAQLGATPGASSGEAASDQPSSSGSTGSVGGGGDGSSSSSSGSTSGGSSGGETKDAGEDAPPPPPPASTGTIACGGTKSCAAGTEICCGSWKGRGKVSFDCEPSGFLACVAGTSIACDDKTDCAEGQVCCGTLDDDSGYTSVACKNKCNNVPGLRSVRFCDPDAAVDECAEIGKYCGPSQSLPGYHVCRD